MKSKLIVPVILSLVAYAAAAGTIKKLDLDAGRESAALAVTPLYEPSGGFHLAIEEFANGFDYERRIFDDLNLTGTKDKLSREIDLGAIFTEALRSQAPVMGLPSGEGGFRVSGTVQDVLVKNREIAFGPLLFYGHVRVGITAVAPDGEETSTTYELHPRAIRYNAGFGSKDENREALAQILLEAAQQTLALLNRELFRLPPHSRISSVIGSLRDGSGLPEDAVIRAVGLSGAEDAVTPLLDRLDGIEHEGARAEVVEALGMIGTPRVAEVLMERYSAEEEDVRYAMLVALNRIRGEEARSFVTSRGANDDERACRNLVEWLGGAPGRD